MKPSVVPEVQCHAWYHQTHHIPSNPLLFTNPWPKKPRQPTFRWLSWLATHLVTTNKLLQILTGQPLHAAPTGYLTTIPICPQTLAATPSPMRVYWLGHATALIQAHGQTIITDPALGRQIGPLPTINHPRVMKAAAKQLDRNWVLRAPRQQDVPISAEQIPEVDVVLISHNHYDHLDKASVVHLAHLFAPLFIVPLGVGRYLRQWGIERIVELDWWQWLTYQGIHYHCTPACHDSLRKPGDRNQTLWCSWFVETNESTPQTLFFAGDTAYASHFQEVRYYLGEPDFALLPIGAYYPRWYLRHVHLDPAEALRAFLDLRAKKLLPIHWGTFDIGGEPIHLPILSLQELAHQKGICPDHLALIPVGGHITLAQPSPLPYLPNK